MRCSKKPAVYLGTGIYLSFLELRSVTSRYAAVIGGVTSEWQRKLIFKLLKTFKTYVS